MADLELELTSQSGSRADVTVHGEIDMATAPQLREFLDGLLAAGSRQIVFDCRDLGFLDSSGIGVLVAARNRLDDDGEIVVDSPPPHVRKVLEITGVNTHLTVTP
ncbi:MAG TPA: STAS domain-containing protein [Acidimicrobiia bacterium]|nr:STAS domain-containing protein [Acidimicrobiia bacterium]